MSRLLSMEFDTKRLTTVGETNKSEYTDNLSSQAGMIQPLSETEEIGMEKVGQNFKLFSERIDLKISDKVICEEIEYTVKSIKDFTYGSFPHLESIIVLL